MKTGLLNNGLRFLGKQAVTDEYGFDTQADVVVYRCWASIEPARGKVFYEMERKADTEYSKITIRWRPGVTHDMKVKSKITSTISTPSSTRICAMKPWSCTVRKK